MQFLQNLVAIEKEEEESPKDDYPTGDCLTISSEHSEEFLLFFWKLWGEKYREKLESSKRYFIAKIKFYAHDAGMGTENGLADGYEQKAPEHSLVITLPHPPIGIRIECDTNWNKTHRRILDLSELNQEPTTKYNGKHTNNLPAKSMKRVNQKKDRNITQPRERTGRANYNNRNKVVFRNFNVNKQKAQKK
jgi:hypothetical protein